LNIITIVLTLRMIWQLCR